MSLVDVLSPSFVSPFDVLAVVEEPSTLMTPHHHHHHLTVDGVPGTISPSSSSAPPTTWSPSSTASATSVYTNIVGGGGPVPIVVTPTMVLPPTRLPLRRRLLDGEEKCGTRACSICHSHKIRCNGGRPCQRCVRLGRAELCRDHVRGEQQIHTRRKSAKQIAAACAAAAVHGGALPNTTLAIAPSVQPSTPRSVVPTTPTIVIISTPNPPITPPTPIMASIVVSASLPAASPVQYVSPSSLPSPLTTLPLSTSSSSSSSTSSSYDILVDAVDAAPPPPLSPPDTTQSPDSSTSFPPPPSSSTSCSMRSASRSPARKKLDRRVSPCRRSPAHDIATTLSYDSVDAPSASTTNGLFPWGPFTLASSSTNTSGSSSSNNSNNNNASTTLVSAWQPSIPFALPSRITLKYSESQTVRDALMMMVPWLKSHLSTFYRPNAPEYNWIQTILAKGSKIRVCPQCHSPTRQCADCRVNKIPTRFGDRFIMSFFAALWSPKEVVVADVRDLERIPSACYAWTLPQLDSLSAQPWEELVAHHRTTLAKLSPHTHVTDLAKLLMCPSSPSDASGVADDTKQQISIAKDEFFTGDPGATSTGVEVPQLPHIPDDLSHYNDGYGGGCGGVVGEPAFLFSMNSELERLLGYSCEEMKSRLHIRGFKADIRFAFATEARDFYRHTMLCVVGLKTRWSMIGHVVSKWHTITRCLVWGQFQESKGYRTNLVFFVPLPGGASIDPATFSTT